MRYIEHNLLQHEKLVYAVRPHWIVFSSGFWAVLFAIYLWLFRPGSFHFEVFNQWDAYHAAATALIAIGIYWLTGAYIYFLTSEYGVTNKRVVIKIGWIQRRSLEIMLEKVEGVLVDQSIVGRMLDYGAITIIGTGGTGDSFPYIPDPLKFHKIVQEQIDLVEQSFRRPE